MTNADNSLSGEFEKIAQKALLEKEADEAISEHDIFRYDFATKVALGEELNADDMFEYLDSWARYNIAFRKAESMELRDYPNLKTDCESKELTETVKTHLMDRIRWAKEAIPVANRSGLKMSQQAFLGIPDNDTVIGRVAKNAIADSASEASWLPFELSGLEKCTGFFTK